MLRAPLGDAGDAGEMIDDEALVLGQVLDHHPQHVVGLATHQARGIIRRCVAVADPQALGLHVNVFVHVSLEKQTQVR
jgi:hypothetical protein